MQKYNVLFISIDDLRPELGCYGKSHIISPNIDQLAEEAILFDRAYSPQALCNPARSALLTGMRPQTLGVFDGSTHFRESQPDIVTLPEHFKNNGYRTYSFGKVFHHRDSQSWHAPSWVPKAEVSYPIYLHQENVDHQRIKIHEGRFNPKSSDWWAEGGHWIPAQSWEAPDVPDTALFDGKITLRAIEKLKEMQHDPFFLAIGFFRPHIPFIVPKKYIEKYSLEDLDLTAFPERPDGAPNVAMTNWGETRQYNDIPQTGPITDQKAREILRGYYASVTYVDAQVGRLISSLKLFDLYDNTIIVLWGDHGYHLGDHGLWGKYTNFENATRVPLLIRVPGEEPRQVKSLVELIDIYPTLSELCALPVFADLEGKSLMSMMRSEDNHGNHLAFSQYPRGNYMGYSVRNDSARYNLWLSDTEATVDELYVYNQDLMERTNLAGEQRYQVLIDTLSKLIKDCYYAEGD